MATEAPEKVEVTITGVFAQYHEVQTNYAGEQFMAISTAVRGDTVTIDKREADRLRGLGVIEDTIEATLERAIGASDRVEPAQAPQPDVSPPSGGRPPVGDLTTGVTEAPETPAPTDESGWTPGGSPVIAPENPDDVPGAGAVAESPAAAEGYDARGKGAVEVLAWIEEQSPTQKAIVAAAQGDAAAAKVVLEAEDLHTKGDPRSTVKKGLTKLIEG